MARTTRTNTTTLTRCLSLPQPWATLIACGAKRLEARSWPTEYRGPVAIHASSRAQIHSDILNDPEPDLIRALGRCGMSTTVRRRKVVDVAAIKALPRSAIVGIATITDCVRADAFTGALTHEQVALVGEIDPTDYVWTFTDPRELIFPILGVKGKLNLWEMPAALKLEIDYTIHTGAGFR